MIYFGLLSLLPLDVAFFAGLIVYDPYAPVP